MLDDDITLEDGKKEIDIYIDKIFEYLKTGKMNLPPKQYMKTYSCIIKLSDEYDLGADLYNIYKEKIDFFLENVVFDKIKSKIGDSQEFLSEYMLQWKNFTIFSFSLKKMFDYLDRYYLKNGGPQNLTETAL